MSNSDEGDRLHARALLRRAAQSLQEYCAEENGTNDSLAIEIEAYLEGKGE